MKKKKAKISPIPWISLTIAALVVILLQLKKKKNNTGNDGVAYYTGEMTQDGYNVIIDPSPIQYRPQDSGYEANSGTTAPTVHGRIQDLPGFPTFLSLRYHYWRADGKKMLRIDFDTDPVSVTWDGAPPI